MSTINEEVVDAGLQVEQEMEEINQEIKRMEAVLSKLQDKASEVLRSGEPAVLARSFTVKKKLDASLKQTKGLLMVRRDELNKLTQMFEEISGLECTTSGPSAACEETSGSQTTGTGTAQLMETTIKPVALWSAEPSVFSPCTSAKPWGPAP